MPLQLANYQDAFGRVNSAAYLKVVAGVWDGITGIVQVSSAVWADKAAHDAGAKPLWEFTKTVPVDPTSLLAAVEAQLMQDTGIAPLSPTTVA